MYRQVADFVKEKGGATDYDVVTSLADGSHAPVAASIESLIQEGGLLRRWGTLYARPELDEAVSRCEESSVSRGVPVAYKLIPLGHEKWMARIAKLPCGRYAATLCDVGESDRCIADTPEDAYAMLAAIAPQVYEFWKGPEPEPELWDHLETRDGESTRQMFFKGTRKRAWTVVCDWMHGDKTIEQVADNHDVTPDAVVEAVIWCNENLELIRQEENDEAQIVSLWYNESLNPQGL